jgi:hypothetical protein
MNEIIANFSNNDLVSKVLPVIGLIIAIQIIRSFYLIIQAKKFIKNADKTNAKIVKLESVGSRRSGYYMLSLAFKDARGRESSRLIKVEEDLNLKEGDMIDILFAQDDPSIVKINKFSFLYEEVVNSVKSIFVAIVVMIVVALFLGVSI